MELESVLGTAGSLEKILQGLIAKGYCFVPDFLSPSMHAELLEEATRLLDSGKMRPAKIGKDLHKKRVPKIRGDLIHWIDFSDTPSPAVREYGHFLYELQEYLRVQLRLPLKSFEGHFAVYPKGSFYKKHLDQHKGSPHRQVSVVCYLNESAHSNGGGEIVLYEEDGKTLRFSTAPQQGALLVFLSALVPHEVKVSHFKRASLTSWLRDDEWLPFSLT